MALILSLGDLTAISLFGTQDFVTLPALIYRQMGSYRFDEAIGTALLLGAMVLAFSTLAERWSAAAMISLDRWPSATRTCRWSSTPIPARQPSRPSSAPAAAASRRCSI
jgi:hypothetical protein